MIINIALDPSYIKTTCMQNMCIPRIYILVLVHINYTYVI